LCKRHSRSMRSSSQEAPGRAVLRRTSYWGYRYDKRSGLMSWSRPSSRPSSIDCSRHTSRNRDPLHNHRSWNTSCRRQVRQGIGTDSRATRWCFQTGKRLVPWLVKLRFVHRESTTKWQRTSRRRDWQRMQYSLCTQNSWFGAQGRIEGAARTTRLRLHYQQHK